MANLPSQSIATAKQIGHLLKAERKGAGMSLDALALQLALAPAEVTQLEKDPGELSVDQLLSWCSALGLQVQLAPVQPARSDLPL